jgi:phenylalanyl-tRNA synthetase beta chain
MFVSLKWMRDYVDLPAELDPHELGERLTLTTAEVEGVERVRIDACKLIVARVESAAELPDTRNLRQVVLNIGEGRTVTTVTGAPVLHTGSNVVYAPPGSHVAAYGDITMTEVAGATSAGMILPGDALGIAMAVQEAVFVSDTMPPGRELPPELFDDWVIEIDNKSITHRPDLWGHYGVAREIAAICGRPLRPYPVVPLEKLAGQTLPEIPISIADRDACPRYCGIVLEGVPTEPAPLWMQLRLGRVGMRPISALVDLTNYVMADLGQPMHAFDAAKVDRIEVDWARDGEVFQTLDGSERRLTSSTLMIKRGGEDIALAGVMGGLETEVAEETTTLLLESANFDPATIRRTATRLGLRTDASARFEKSLDPGHARLAIQRFIHLAKEIYPNLTLKSRMSDGYPKPLQEISITVNPGHVSRMIGRDVSLDETTRLLGPLGFEVEGDDSGWSVRVPSFRATNDISIEADVIEEIARCAGYDTIEPALPRVTMRRFEANALHELEQRTLEYLTTAHRFNEVHGYLWYDAAWLRQLKIDAGRCVELANPAAEGLHQLRRTLMPGLLAAVTRNRFHFPALSVIELGSVFELGDHGDDREYRHVGLVSARRGKPAADDLYKNLKGAIEGWAWQRYARPIAFMPLEPDSGDLDGAGPSFQSVEPWIHPHRTARVLLGERTIGYVSVIGRTLRRAMDEHLAQWSIAWAELRLNGLVAAPLVDGKQSLTLTEVLGTIPEYPVVEMDFSFLVPAATQYTEVLEKLASFRNPLLEQLRYVGSYEGESIRSDRRSLTVRTVCGDDTRTLEEEDLTAFRLRFEEHLAQCGYEIRR